jgi:hypothetical protein
MGIFERSMFAAPDDEAGVFIDWLGRALVILVAMQQRTMTVGEAAMAFNTTPDVIREAVEDASWIYITGDDGDPSTQTLELDGE